MSRTDVATIQSADIVIFVLDVAAALAFGAALALLAFAGGPLQTQALVAHLALAVALIAAFLSHNLLGRRPLYWSHFDFLAAMFGAFLAADVDVHFILLQLRLVNDGADLLNQVIKTRAKAQQATGADGSPAS